MTITRRGFTIGALAGGVTLLSSSQGPYAAGRPDEWETPRIFETEAFLDAIGVNTHMWDAYQSDGRRFDQLRSRLLELGVRHVRDSANGNYDAYAGRLNELGQHGVRFNLIVDPRPPAEGVRNGLDFVTGVRDCVDSVEGPNEFDNSGRTDWRAELITFQDDLFTSCRKLFGPDLRVVAPSFVSTAAYTTMPEVGRFADCSNLHAYFASNLPETTGFGVLELTGYGSIPWAMAKAAAQVPGAPVYVTESGYPTDVTAGAPPWAVPDAIAARYLPRLLAGFFEAGAKRIYLHELLDRPDGSEPAGQTRFGLLREDEAMSPKPAFTALRDMIGILGSQAAARPASRRTAVWLEGDLTDVRTMTLRSRDGRIHVLIWIEQASWDTATNSIAPPISRNLFVTIRPRPGAFTHHRFDDSGERRSVQLGTDAARQPIRVSDGISIIALAG